MPEVCADGGGTNACHLPLDLYYKEAGFHTVKKKSSLFPNAAREVAVGDREVANDCLENLIRMKEHLRGKVHLTEMYAKTAVTTRPWFMKLPAFVSTGLMRFFSRSSRIVLEHRPIVIVIFLVACALAGASYMWLTEVEYEGEELWNPTDLRGYKDRQVLKDTFPADGKPVGIIFYADTGLIRTPFLLQLHHILQTIDTNMRFEELCNRPAPFAACPRVSILKAWNYSRAAIAADPNPRDTLRSFLRDTTIESHRYAVSHPPGDPDTIVAITESMVYRKGADGLEDAEQDIETLIHDVWPTLPDVDFVGAEVITAGSVNREIARVVQQDVLLVIASIILVILFCGVMLGDGSIVGSRLLLGTGGAVLMLSAFVLGVGVLGAWGMKKTPATPLVLFVLIGIGVDDVIIIVDSYSHHWYLEDRKKRMSRSLSSSGPAITLTTVTDMLAFAVGAMATMPAVRAFTVTALVVIGFDFVLQCSVFLIALDTDQSRIDALRYDVLFCLVSPDRYITAKDVVCRLFFPAGEHNQMRLDRLRNSERALENAHNAINLRETDVLLVEPAPDPGQELTKVAMDNSDAAVNGSGKPARKGSNAGARLRVLPIDAVDAETDESGSGNDTPENVSPRGGVSPVPRYKGPAARRSSLTLLSRSASPRAAPPLSGTQTPPCDGAASPLQTPLSRCASNARRRSFITGTLLDAGDLRKSLRKMHPAPSACSSVSGMLTTTNDSLYADFVSHADCDTDTDTEATAPSEQPHLSLSANPLVTASLSNTQDSEPPQPLSRRDSAAMANHVMIVSPATSFRSRMSALEGANEGQKRRRSEDAEHEKMIEKQKSLIAKLITDYYAPAVTSPVGRVLVVLVFLAFAGFNGTRIAELGTGLATQDTLPSNSFVTDYFDLQTKYFQGVPSTVTVVLPYRIDYSVPESAEKVLQLKQMLEEVPSILSFDPWVLAFYDHAAAAHNMTVYSPGFTDVFSSAFLTFVAGRPSVLPLVNYRVGADGGVTIDAVRFEGRQRLDDDSARKINDMNSGRRQFERWQATSGWAGVITGKWYAFADADDHIQWIIMKNLLFAAIAVLVALLLFMPPLMAIFVTATVGLIDLSILGWMWMTEVNMSAVSYIVIAMSIGLSVDYCAHIAIAFTNCRLEEDHEVRRKGLQSAATYARRGLDEIGSSVLAGGMSTLLGVLALAFASSQTFFMFFKMLFAAIMFGILHGFVFFPSFLSCLPASLLKHVILDPI